jgi:hypothetical protein
MTTHSKPQPSYLPLLRHVQAAQRPFWGVTGAYSRTVDPWHDRPDLTAFRRTFWQRALEWLGQVGAWRNISWLLISL